jgi:hypothetical protein
VCATCSEHFTRKYSATRHNLTIHKGIGEIVTLLEYLVGRNSGRYRPSHPSLYRTRRGEKRMHNVGNATTAVADSMGDTFRHRGLQGHYRYQQHAPPPSIVPPSTQDVSLSQPMKTTNDHGTISQETKLKIQELKRLVYSNPNQRELEKGFYYYCLNSWEMRNQSPTQWILDSGLNTIHWILEILSMLILYFYLKFNMLNQRCLLQLIRLYNPFSS